MVLGFRLFVHCKLVAVWWMANKWSFCFIIAFHNFATLENRLTYRCPRSWPVVITMKKKLAGTWEKTIGYWPVQMNGNKFATGQILRKPVEVVKGWILAGGAQKSPEPWSGSARFSQCWFLTWPECSYVCVRLLSTLWLFLSNIVVSFSVISSKIYYLD
jgi:hypothetical protein